MPNRMMQANCDEVRAALSYSLSLTLSLCKPLFLFRSQAHSSNLFFLIWIVFRMENEASQWERATERGRARGRKKENARKTRAIAFKSNRNEPTVKPWETCTKFGSYTGLHYSTLLFLTCISLLYIHIHLNSRKTIAIYQCIDINWLSWRVRLKALKNN